MLILVGFKTQNGHTAQYGIRTPLRYLIEGVFDARGTDAGLNITEQMERM